MCKYFIKLLLVFIPVQLVKENYMTEPRVRVGGTIKLTGQRVLIPEYH